MSQIQSEELSFKPQIQDIKTYNLKYFQSDFWAALAVALLSIPQGIAYSIVAGLPPACGIWATVLGTIVAALFGSSRLLVVGPGNATTLLVQTATAEVLLRYYQDIVEPLRTAVALEVMAAITLLIGVFQLLAGIFKFGQIIQFVSHAVVIGYVAGTAVALSLDQLFNFFGIHTPIEAGSIYEKIKYLVFHFDQIHIITTLVGILTIFLLILMKRMNTRLPHLLSAVACITLISVAFGLESIPDHAGRTMEIVGQSGLVEQVVPGVQFPLFEMRLLNGMLPLAFAIALIGMLETSSIGKSLASNSGQHLSINQDIFGLGLANTMLSFFGALPCSASISRCILNYESGAKTRFSAVLSGIIVAVIVGVFGFLIKYVPLCALAAMLLATAIRMVDRRQLKLCFEATRADAIVLVITFLSCIFFSLQLAFYIGIGLSIFLYLKRAAIPQVVEYYYNPNTDELRPMHEQERKLPHKIRVINVEGELFFGATDLFQSSLQAIAEDDTTTEVIILRLKHVRDMDATAVLALQQLVRFLKKNERHLIVSAIPKQVYQVLENAKFSALVGQDNLIPYDKRLPNKAIGDAYKRAEHLLEVKERPIPEVAEDKNLLSLALDTPLSGPHKLIKWLLRR